MNTNTARTTSSPGDVPTSNSSGVRRVDRDLNRQRNYVLDQDWKNKRDWNSQIETEASLDNRQQQQPNPQRTARNRNRALQWRKKKQDQQRTTQPQDLSQYRSTTSTEPRDEPLYELVAGSRPVKRIYSQNGDFSTFPILCETVHRELKQTNPRIKRELPFCVFLHSMTSCLNAWLFRTVTDLNSEDRYSGEKDAMSLIPAEMLIPQAIAEYLTMINTVITPNGDTVKLNVAESALPQHSIPHEEGKDRIPPGSFGDVTALTHNAYECYVSPYVTRRFVEASGNDEAEYLPLPAGRFPANTVPTRNLLGYFPMERLTPEGRAVINNYVFPESNDMAGRLQIVPAMLQETSNALFRCSKEFRMTKYHEVQRKPVATLMVYSRTDATESPNSSEVARTVSNVHSPFAFGNATATQATLFSLKRKRTDNARGLCYVDANGRAPANWSAHINDNFKMEHLFQPSIGVDGEHLRSDLHQAFPPDGTKEGFLSDWLKAFKLEKK